MIRVTCAIILNSEGKVLCTQRSASMSDPLKWEFPGGKLEPGETAAEAIVREIREELALEIEVVLRGPSSMRRHDGQEILELVPFVCRIQRGEIRLQEHAEAHWFSAPALIDLDWSDADVPIVQWWLAGMPSS
jgi:8-oxo-dGTP diphosphatase